jgi:Type II CAAX prenyl endopeptidase Rce1-like
MTLIILWLVSSVLRWIILFCVVILALSNLLFRWRNNNNNNKNHEKTSHPNNSFMILRCITFHFLLSFLLFVLLWLFVRYYVNEENDNDDDTKPAIWSKSERRKRLESTLFFHIFPMIVLWRPLKELCVGMILHWIPSSRWNGGPLGIGYGKFMEVGSAIMLSYCFDVNYELSHFTSFTRSATSQFLHGSSTVSMDSIILSWLSMMITITVTGVVVNIVLWLWSRYCYCNEQKEIVATSDPCNNSNTTKHGSHTLTMDHSQDSTTNHQTLRCLIPSEKVDLTILDHVKLLIWAFLNASCEEYTSRNYWRNIGHNIILLLFPSIKSLSSDSSSTMFSLLLQSSNIFQSIIFGGWHYYGIPNGMVGVLLTFMYGMIMGSISDYYSSRHPNTYSSHYYNYHCSHLLYPIVLHTIADYYIFAYVVRRSEK